MSNITVAVRVRPLIARELRDKMPEVWKINGTTIYPIDPVTKKSVGERYTVDQIYSEEFSVSDIYSAIAKPILDAVVNGYNGTIFAYGQTSSGKTYTMMGDNNSKGIIQLAIADIFEMIENVRDRKFLLRCQYVELYNDKVFDLLNNNKECKIRESENGEPKTDAREILVDSESALLQVLDEGTKARKVGETKANEKSSRSHAVFRIIMESTKFGNDEIAAQVGQLNLVDLAGSERASVTQATGARLKEGAQINKSLSALGLVIKQLTESREHVNFRDSKLTRLLEPSLGGNALTAIICAVTPAALEETHSTLAFACRAKNIKNKPILNIVENPESSLLNRFSLEIKRLNEELAKASISSQEQDELNKVLAEKVALLEERLIYRSRLIEKKKKDSRRRQTWGGASLPIINEGATWEQSRLSDPPLVKQNPQENADRLEQPGPSNAFHGEADEQFVSHPAQNVQEQDENDDTLEEDDSDDTAENPETVVQWLIDDNVVTPRSVLKQRAIYYENEFKSLQDLTSAEQTLSNERLENLLKELEEANQALVIEQRKRQSDCTALKQQIENLEAEIGMQTVLVSELQEFRESQSNAYMKELCDHKTVLDYLRDQLMAIHKSCAPESVERLNEVVKNFDKKINDLYHIVSQLDGQKDKPQDFQPAISVLKSICDETAEVEQSLNELPEDAVEFFRIFKSLCDLVTELMILTVMKDDKHLTPSKMISIKKSQEKLFKLKAVIVTKDAEIEELSDKIMEYLSQLEEAESQVAEMKEAAVYFQNQSDIKDRQLTAYFLQIETLQEKCLNITRMTDLKIKVLKDELDNWKKKYKEAEKEVVIRIDEEMEYHVNCWEKDDMIIDLKKKFQLLQSQCEHFLRKFNLVDSNDPLTVDEILNGLNEQERHITNLQTVVGDLKQKMEELRMLHLPSSYVDCVETNRVRARDEEIKSLNETVHRQSVQLDEYRNILSPSDKPESRSIIYYMEKQSIELNELKHVNDVLQNKNHFLIEDSEAKDKLIKEQAKQIQQLKSELVKSQNILSNEYVRKQESMKADRQVAHEQHDVTLEKIAQLEIDLEQKNILLKQIKDYFSTRTEKDELNDIFKLKDSESFKEKKMSFESMKNELNLRNNKIAELKKLMQEKDLVNVNVMRERDLAARNLQELRLLYSDTQKVLEKSATDVVELRCSLINQDTLTASVKKLTNDIAEKNKMIQDLTKVSHEKYHFVKLSQDQETKIASLEGQLDRRIGTCTELSDEVKRLAYDLADKNEVICTLQSLLEKKSNALDLQDNNVTSLKNSLTFNITELNDKIAELNAKLTAKRKNIQKMDIELQTLKDILSDTTSELKDKDNTIKIIENLVKHKDEIIKSEQNKMIQLQESMHKFTSELTSNKEHIQSLEAEKNEAVQEKESLIIRCDELAEKLNNLYFELTHKDEQLKTASSVKDSLILHSDELSDKVKNLTLALVDKDDLVDEKNKALHVTESLTKRCDFLTARITHLTAELADKDEQLEEKDKALRAKESISCDELSDQLRQKESLAVRCNELSEKIQDLTSELAEKENELRAKELLTIHCEKLSEKINCLTKELAEKEEELSGKELLTIHCDELSGKINHLTKELAEKEEELVGKELLTTHCDKLSEKINRLTMELAKKEDELRGKEHSDELPEKINRLTSELAEKEEELRTKERLSIHCDELSEKLNRLTLELARKEEELRKKESLSIHCAELSNKIKLLTVQLDEEDSELHRKESLAMCCDQLTERINLLTEELNAKEELQEEIRILDGVKVPLTTHCIELSQKIKQLNIELCEADILREEKNDVIREKESLIFNCEELSERIDALTLELTDKDQYIKSIEKLVKDKDEQLSCEESVNQSLQQTFRGFHERIDNLSVEMSKKNEETQQLQILLTQKEDLLNLIRADHKSELCAKDKHINTMRFLMEKNDTALKSQQSKINNLNDTMAKLTSDHEIETQRLNLTINDLQLTISKMKDEVIVLEEQAVEIEELKALVKKQETDIPSLLHKVTNLVQDVAVRDDEINKLSKTVEQKSVALEHHKALINHLHEINNKSKETIEAKDSDIKELTTFKSSFNKMQTKLNVLLNQYNSIKGLYKSREGEIEGLKAEVTNLNKKYQSLEQQSEVWKAQYAIVKKENEELMTKISSIHAEEQLKKDTNVLLRAELERQKDRFKNISLELDDLRRRYTTLNEDNRAVKAALESANDSIRRLKLERLQMDAEKTQLDENLKSANVEITRRLRERDLLKRELRNTQFDASRNLQDAQTETETLSEASGELSSKSSATSLDPVSTDGTTSPDEEPQQFNSLEEEMVHLKDKLKTLEHKYRAVKKVCIMRKEKLDTLKK